MKKHNAIGYILREESGTQQPWHETEIRSLAKRWGFNLMKTYVFNANTIDRAERLRAIVARLGVEAVFVPSLRHLEADADALIQVCTVVDVSGERAYKPETSARR